MLLGLAPAQERNAGVIVYEVIRRGLPRAAAVIAVMAALAESGLRNYANVHNPESLELPHDQDAIGSDHGSVGIFQQQVGGAPNSTADWGTTAELMNPRIAAGKFLAALLAVDGWQTLPPWLAAQRVQGSIYPDGSNYRLRYERAAEIVAALWTDLPPHEEQEMIIVQIDSNGGHDGVGIFAGTSARVLGKTAGIALNKLLDTLPEGQRPPTGRLELQDWRDLTAE